MGVIITAFFEGQLSFASDARTPWSSSHYVDPLPDYPALGSLPSSLSYLLGDFYPISVVTNYFQVFDFLPRFSLSFELSFDQVSVILSHSTFVHYLSFFLDCVYPKCWDRICAVPVGVST